MTGVATEAGHFGGSTSKCTIMYRIKLGSVITNTVRANF